MRYQMRYSVWHRPRLLYRHADVYRVRYRAGYGYRYRLRYWNGDSVVQFAVGMTGWNVRRYLVEFGSLDFVLFRS